MKPTAYSQIGEQLVRVAVIIIAAYIVVTDGDSFYKVGQAAGVAAVGGALAALLILRVFLLKYPPKLAEEKVISWRYYIRPILLIGLIDSLNHIVLLIIRFADTFTLVRILKDYGLEKIEAMTMKGVFDRGQPLIQVGTVVGTSFARALMPNLTREKSKSLSNARYESVQSALNFSFYLSFGAMLGLVLIFPETN